MSEPSERLIDLASWHVEVDEDDNNRPYWSGWCSGDKDGGAFEGPLIMDPEHFAPGTVVKVWEPEDTGDFYSTMLANPVVSSVHREIDSLKTQLAALRTAADRLAEAADECVEWAAGDVCSYSMIVALIADLNQELKSYRTLTASPQPLPVEPTDAK
jgi:hypothetical protein